MSLIDGFVESDHPRGQPGNAGQFASSGGSGSKGSMSRGTGHGAKPQSNFKGSLAYQTNGDTTQPVKSVSELYARAKKAEAPFKSNVESIATKYGAEVQYTPEAYAEPGSILKSRSSAERKLKDELNNDPKLLRDVIRATVVSDKVESTRRAAADFIAEHGDQILRVKDRYVDELNGGYRDILINYRTPEGLVAEIQFNSKNMVKAKLEKAHALYEKFRELKAPTPKEVEALEGQMRMIYEVAYREDGNGHGWKEPEHSMKAKDAADAKVALRRYKLSQAEGPEFEAALVNDGPGDSVTVYTNKSGKWEPDDSINWVDLVMPEQKLGDDWDVTPLEAGPLQDKVPARATDRRHIDANDVEYYTAESLGPNRERTPEGFLICYDVPAARIGEMIYGPGEVPMELGTGMDGRVRVTRAASEVFDRRSMASLNGKPVTDDHPPVDVDPKNWRHYTKGVVVSPRRGEGDQDDFLIVDMIIFDEDTIKDIEAGKREVSCGYNPDYLQLLDAETEQPIPGRGEQVNIRYNHLALVKAGRCGPHCAIGDRRTVDEERNSFFTPERERRLRRILRRFA